MRFQRRLCQRPSVTCDANRYIERDINPKGVGVRLSPRNFEFDSETPTEYEDLNGRVQIFVHGLDGNSLCIDLDMHETVYGLKEEICMRTNVPPRSQRLLFAGQNLRDSRTLKSYGIRKSSVIELSMSLRGGFITPMCLLGCFLGLAFGIPLLKFAITPIMKFREEMKARRAEEERKRKKGKKKKKKDKKGKKSQKVASG
jgi:hypothetical protein